MMVDQQLRASQDYWVRRLAQRGYGATLRPDVARPDHAQAGRETLPFSIEGPLYERLVSLTSGGPFLIYTTLVAAIKACLFQYTANPLVITGSPARRPEGDTPPLENALAIVDTLRDSLSGRELLMMVRQTLLEAYSQQAYPFQELLQDLGLGAIQNRCPLFDVAITLEEIHGPLPEVNNDITFCFRRESAALVGKITYRSPLFHPGRIAAFCGHVLTLLQGLVENPQLPIGQLSMIPATERQLLLYGWNPRGLSEFPETILPWLERVAAHTPQATALWAGDQPLTYQALHRRANQLAHHLQARGVGPEVRVGLCLERSVDLVVGMLAILKAGGAYVPLDPHYPPARLAWIVADAQVKLILTEERWVARLPEESTVPVTLDQLQDRIAQEPVTPPRCDGRGDTLAYVLYTSGSSGLPKGVMITHAALANHMHWMQRTYPLAPSDVVMQRTSFAFDASMWEFFAPLLAGAQLALAPVESQWDSTALIDEIMRRQATVLQLVPSLLSLLLAEDHLARCVSLRRVFCGGEPLPTELVRRFSDRMDATLYNLYGPTETTIDATSYSCEAQSLHGEICPIGRPITNIWLYLLSSEMEPVPLGASGEIYLGGVALARGYLNQPALTAERFVPDPFSSYPGARLYRTGDMARYLPDGTLEFLGRIDLQVKFHGFRIELEEIEAVLAAHPAVQQAVVVIREDRPGDRRLVGYFVPRPTMVAEAAELAEALRARLPEYMVPQILQPLADLPRLPNGKIDRSTLPKPSYGSEAFCSVAPQGELEQWIAGVWGEVLGIEQVGAQRNFFDLGGHSLLMFQVYSRLHERFPHRLTLLDLYTYPTVQTLAAYLGQESAVPTQEAGQGTVPEQKREAGKDRQRQQRSKLIANRRVAGNHDE